MAACRRIECKIRPAVPNALVHCYEGKRSWCFTDRKLPGIFTLPTQPTHLRTAVGLRTPVWSLHRLPRSCPHLVFEPLFSLNFFKVGCEKPNGTWADIRLMWCVVFVLGNNVVNYYNWIYGHKWSDDLFLFHNTMSSIAAKTFPPWFNAHIKIYLYYIYLHEKYIIICIWMTRVSSFLFSFSQLFWSWFDSRLPPGVGWRIASMMLDLTWISCPPNKMKQQYLINKTKEITVAKS
jgi:hypothetical protein